MARLGSPVGCLATYIHAVLYSAWFGSCWMCVSWTETVLSTGLNNCKQRPVLSGKGLVHYRESSTRFSTPGIFSWTNPIRKLFPVSDTRRNVFRADIRICWNLFRVDQTPRNFFRRVWYPAEICCEGVWYRAEFIYKGMIPRWPDHDPTESYQKIARACQSFKGTLFQNCLHIKITLTLYLKFFSVPRVSDPGE